MALYDIARRLLPRRVRAGLRETLIRGVGGDPRAQQWNLWARVRRLEEEVFRLSPPEIVRDSETDRAIAEFVAREKLGPQFEAGISKHDAMYRYLDFFAPSRLHSYCQYLETGLEAFRTFEAIADERLEGLGELDAVLDFASGHGRVTRFLVGAMEPQRLWVSDVKPNAIDFQIEKFGVRGFVAPMEPSDLEVEGRFQLVLVASLFTHLPEERFGQWLRALHATLAPGGLLVFSTSDISEAYEATDQPFAHRADNEDSLAVYVEDELSQADDYGTTWVREDFVRERIAELGIDPSLAERRPKALWGNQDLWIVPATGRQAPVSRRRA